MNIYAMFPRIVVDFVNRSILIFSIKTTIDDLKNTQKVQFQIC